MIQENNKLKRISERLDKKKRLFVDIDGTMAEWRKITLVIESEEDRFDVMQKLNDILLTPGYFATLKPQENVIQAIELLSDTYEVFGLSCYMKKEGVPNPKSEKNEWMDKHTPFIDKDHRIFVPDGEDKMLYIPGGIQIGDSLLDDYSKNLKDASRAGMIAIKLLNDVNGSKGEWYGPCVSMEYSAAKIASGIKAVVEREELVRHTAPKKAESSILTVDRNTDLNEIDFERDIFS